MTETEVFILSDEALNAVVTQIKPDQWSMKLPDWFRTGRTQADPTLRTVINDHAYDDIWVPDVLAGKTAQEVGNKYNGDLLGENPADSLAKIATTAVAAVRALTPADLNKTAHLSYGDFPVREYLKHITSFRGFRAYDIAKFIGADTTLPPDLVAGMWDEFAPEVEEWRAMGVFAPEVKVPATAPLQDRLLGLVGRDPKA